MNEGAPSVYTVYTVQLLHFKGMDHSGMKTSGQRQYSLIIIKKIKKNAFNLFFRFSRPFDKCPLKFQEQFSNFPESYSI